MVGMSEEDSHSCPQPKRNSVISHTHPQFFNGALGSALIRQTWLSPSATTGPAHAELVTDPLPLGRLSLALSAGAPWTLPGKVHPPTHTPTHPSALNSSITSSKELPPLSKLLISATDLTTLGSFLYVLPPCFLYGIFLHCFQMFIYFSWLCKEYVHYMNLENS